MQPIGVRQNVLSQCDVAYTDNDKKSACKRFDAETPVAYKGSVAIKGRCL